MRQILLAIVFLAVLLFIVAPVTFSQVICTPIGNITNCGGPNGMSTTQVPLSRNGGVIITDRETIPYTILPSQPSRGFDPAPLPSSPSYGNSYGRSSYGSDTLILPGASGGSYGSYGSGGMYGGLGYGE